MWNGKASSWDGNVNLFMINIRGTEASLPELTEAFDHPVLQDDSEQDTIARYGASKWYIYITDEEGVVQRMHYKLTMPDENERLIDFVDDLVEGGS